MSEELIDRRLTYSELTRKFSGIALARPTRGWLALFALSGALAIVFLVSVAVVVWRGVGVWGINIPVAWGFAIANFVWWIGIGHAGTLISAFLLLLNQEWRTSINRFAEAMTLFALLCAGLFPLLHLGRPFVFYWLLPYPNTMGLTPQFRSALVWDLFAMLAYGVVSFLFWYLGMLPDLATLRDRSRRTWARRAFGLAALGWRGSGKQWILLQRTHRLLAGLAAVLVMSFHGLVSLAVTVLPGWHSTIFPAYFIAGALFSGLAMLLLIAVPLRGALRLHDVITERHFDLLGKLTLTAGLVVAYGYFNEFALVLVRGDTMERQLLWERVSGPYAPMFWAIFICNVLVTQLLWSSRIRRNAVALFAVAAAITIGMWSDRFMIVASALHRDFLPSSWRMFTPTLWDWTTFAGSIGLFALLFVLFLKFLPLASVHELKELVTDIDAIDVPPLATPMRPKRLARKRWAGGLLAEFPNPKTLIDAAAEARIRGYERFDTFSPFQIVELRPLLRSRQAVIALIAFAGGIGGLVTAYGLQYFANVLHYPLNVGGRPLHSWPAFIPLAFELTLLGAAIGAVAGFLVFTGLPRLDHPLFAVERFDRATNDGFFLFIDARDRKYGGARGWIERHRPLAIDEVSA